MNTLPILDGVRVKRLHDIGGNRLLHGMIDLFGQHAPMRVTTALQAFLCGDLDTVYRTMHSLKSTAANFGATRLSELSRELEAAAQRSDSALVAQLLTRLESVYADTREALLQQRLSEPAPACALVENRSFATQPTPTPLSRR
jgi:HPt (histidine-containing phosphotransfer) domain-containing protein